MNFEPIIDDIIAREQGYVDNPADKGGPTNYGITLAVARANHYEGDMRDLPLALARSIYRNRYIAEPKFDLVAQENEAVGAELIDTGVNMGPSVASTFLQRWLNGFNADGSHYADVFVDGRIGGVTLQALHAFLRWRGDEGGRVLVRALNSVQGARYLDITEHNQSQREFLYGWIKNRVSEA